METYTFIKDRNADDNVILAVASDRIVTLLLHETYDSDGQELGHESAEDYSIENSQTCAYDDLKKAIREKFDVTIDFEIDTDSLESDELEEEGIDADELCEFIEEWKEENENYTTVKGFNYWDGRKWQTVVTYHEFYDPSYEIIDEDVDLMNQEIEDKEFIEEGYGVRNYESANFIIVQSAMQESFENFKLYPKSEFSDIEEIY